MPLRKKQVLHKGRTCVVVARVDVCVERYFNTVLFSGWATALFSRETEWERATLFPGIEKEVLFSLWLMFK